MKHIKIVNGQLIRKSRSTLAQAAQELAESLKDAPGGQGQVIFICPNYAIVRGLREHTIWMR